MSEADDQAFDKLLEMVGNDGKFQLIFGWVFSVGFITCATMAYMNIILVMAPPKHNCHVPGRENFNLSVEEWRNLTLPIEFDNRDISSYSQCKMYNISSVLQLPYEKWNFTDSDIIDCAHGYDYDKTFYEKTPVGDEDWVCGRELYQTNTFVFTRIGEVVGTLVFGQLGDILGRRPVFYISVALIIFGRVMSTMTTFIYWLFASAAIIGMLTSATIFTSPLIIAMETGKEEDRAKISMYQRLGWTLGNCLLPLVFWLVRDWIWFLLLTSLPVLIFTVIPKYMIESPRWLATKGRFKECARELQKIADINGKDVKITESILEEMMPNQIVEPVYGIASLFCHWRLAKNTLLLLVSWIIGNLGYFILVLNSTRMDGNPFLNFFLLSVIELPAYISGKYLGDKIGRRFTNVLAFTAAFIACFPIILTIKIPEYDEMISVAFSVFIILCISISSYIVNLQSVEIYPTCLRQTGISFGMIVGSIFAILGPYIVYLGASFDARYPFFVLAGISLFGVFSSLFLPETLHQNLPNTIREANSFGKDQSFWHLPKKIPEVVPAKNLFQSTETQLSAV